MNYLRPQFSQDLIHRQGEIDYKIGQYIKEESIRQGFLISTKHLRLYNLRSLLRFDDKKGQAKRDILKALHYTLLLYHFSGQLKETTTRGYETF